jgi:transcriptional regulator with XRE-family HTH domain
MEDALGVGRELLSARTAQRRSLREVAQAAGISAAYLQKLERAQVGEPSPRILLRLADTLGISYRRLMEWAGYDLPATSRKLSPVADRVLAARLTEAEEKAVAAFVEHLIAQRPAK